MGTGRVTGTYYWRIKNKFSKNFKSEEAAKKYLQEKIKKDKSILGNNWLIYVKSQLMDKHIGYYGKSGMWRSKH